MALLGKLCPGKSATHVHEALSGTVVVDGKEILRTKLSQVYPHQLCEAYASATTSVGLQLQRLGTRPTTVEAEDLMPSKLAISEVEADVPMPLALAETRPVRSKG